MDPLPTHGFNTQSTACVLAVDLGSSGLRGALIDRRGTLLAKATVPLSVTVDAQGWSEADPEDWWRALQAVSAQLRALAPNAWRQVAAVAVSAVTRCQVLVDGKTGLVIRPALMWRDTRAGALIKSLRERCPAEHRETREISAFHPLARLAWLAEHEAQSIHSNSKVLEPKDFLNFKLTGLLATDRVSSARLLQCATPVQGTSLFEAARLPTEMLPQVLSPLAQIGQVLPGLGGALSEVAGAKVIAMAHDTWASVVGLGAMRAGAAYNLSGTTEVFGLIESGPHEASGLLTVDWTDGNWQIGGPSQSGADVLMWWAEVTGVKPVLRGQAGASLDTLLAQPRQPEPILFLPYLQGERVPWWDPDLRGAFIGLNRRHTHVDMAWAVIEGVSFLNRTVLERAQHAVARRVSEIRFGGGGASSHYWRQAKANILNCDIVCPFESDEGLMGAAIAAWTSLGEFVSLTQAQIECVPQSDITHPDPARVEHYSRAYGLFLEAEQALLPISHRLARWGDVS